jgi:alkanesulfonate monooxygenase SsuD/methylene tetrahydromethanopterin reductase-like flavin-dependent oxidoreductase (luciferase family)
MVQLAKRGEPFLMNVQTYEITKSRFELYRKTMREAGFSEARIRENVAKCWIWRNVFVADNDEEAERVGAPAFKQMVANRAVMRRKVYAEQGLPLPDAGNEGAPSHLDVDKALIRGSVATVKQAFVKLAELEIGGVITGFRLGPLSRDQADKSLTLFMEKVAGALR